MAVTGPAELTAAATLIDFWHPNISAAVWYTVFIVCIALVSYFGVRVYGEVNMSNSKFAINTDTEQRRKSSFQRSKLL